MRIISEERQCLPSEEIGQIGLRAHRQSGQIDLNQNDNIPVM